MHPRARRIFTAALAAHDRSAALERLARELSHELANPLSTILANVAFALEHVRAGDLVEVEPALSDARSAADRVAALLREMALAQCSEPGAAPPAATPPPGEERRRG
ncbi:MAG TPA: histidine kinase dimerization/phospho-acceptor domain-containing protein [Anaeromyxobacteraceae bacterium]|nr:histidine kinase dimerization/phospho-acceptor domain-containing protein [Anaeromyxobacteraceae bacterium]